MAETGFDSVATSPQDPHMEIVTAPIAVPHPGHSSGGKLFRQELQGHIATQTGVLRLADHIQSTAAELLCDFLVGIGLADHG